MIEITIITVANLHFSSSELIATPGILFGTWWVWRSRFGLGRVAITLQRHALPNRRQKPAERLSQSPAPLTLAEPQEVPRRLP